jgi:hypothetical protein
MRLKKDKNGLESGVYARRKGKIWKRLEEFIDLD